MGLPGHQPTEDLTMRHRSRVAVIAVAASGQRNGIISLRRSEPDNERDGRRHTRRAHHLTSVGPYAAIEATFSG